MKLLLDTHVWIWAEEQPERIGTRTRRLLTAAEHDTAICPVSTLEISRLIAAGDIELSMPLADWVAQSMAGLAAQTVPFTHAVAMEAYSLPAPFHRDPADRVLIAAARLSSLTLVTADDRILAYPHVRTQDARR